MGYGLTLILAILGALCVVFVVLPLRNVAKIKRAIEAQFGRPPKVPAGLANAEKFYAALNRHHPADFPVDDLTWHDLDCDAVYLNMNTCNSATGDVHLYSTLRRPLTQRQPLQNALENREALARLFAKDPKLRADVQYRLARLGKLDGEALEMVVFKPQAISLHRHWLYRLMAFVPLLGIALLFLNQTLGIIVLGGGVMANFNLFALAKHKNDSGFRSVRYLAGAIAAAQRIAQLLAKQAPAQAQQLRQNAGRFGALRRSILMLELDNLLEESIGFDPLAFSLMPLLSYGRVVKKLAGSGPDTLALYQALGEIDMAICLLSWQKTLPIYCRPALLEEEEVRFEMLCHPMLPAPVPNSGTFAWDVLLTGSNASGKSTFIKAVALNCILAQTVGTCTAQSFALRCGAVATSMAVADSVVDGDSYFVAEIKSMRRLVQLAEKATFSWLFIDEILKGTNTVERIAASAAVLRQLNSCPCICFAATHDIELTAILSDIYDNYHFRETVDEDGVRFDYKLHSGPATSRNAILLLQRLGFGAAVTDEANRAVAHFEQTGGWALPG